MTGMLNLFSAALVVFCAFIGTSVHAATPIVESQCVTPEPSIFHWWPGDGAPVDFASGRLATNKGGLAYGNAVVQSGFAFDGLDDRQWFFQTPFTLSSSNISAYLMLKLAFGPA
jgi:hypothetical protein